MSSLVSSLWSWHDLVMGVLHLWEPLGIVAPGGVHSSLADELAMHMSLAWVDGDIVRRVVRADDDRWVLDGVFRLTRERNQVWTDEVATLHRAAARMQALALELEPSDPDEAAWWLGVSGELVQALAEYVPMSRSDVERELAEADSSAALIGGAMLEQLELLEFVELPGAPAPVVFGCVVDAERAMVASRSVGVVVLPIPSASAEVARKFSVANGFCPLVALVIAYPCSQWLPRYLVSACNGAVAEWCVGRADGREVWCSLLPSRSVSEAAAAVAARIESDIDVRICGATSDRVMWGALEVELRSFAERTEEVR